MPRKQGRGGNIGRRSWTSQRLNNRTTEQQAAHNQNVTANMEQMRSSESPRHRNARRLENAERQRQLRQHATDAQRSSHSQARRTSRALTRTELVRLAFEYDPVIDYSSHSKIAISEMDKECQHCHALKFKNETPGLCCASGKVLLPVLHTPPEPLQSLLAGLTADSKLFLRKVRKFNSCFQMSSFEATKVITNTNDGQNFQSTFKIQGQVYHQMGSLMPMPDSDPKFLQIYFMGNDEERVSTRCQYNFIEKAQERAIVELLDTFLSNRNQLIHLFKAVSPQLRNDNYQIVIKADKVPVGQHAGRFNAPTVDEIAVIMIGDPTQNRDIKITRRNNTLQTISDTHRSYDALQYPMIFWDGADGYHINIKERNPSTGKIYMLQINVSHLFYLLHNFHY